MWSKKQEKIIRSLQLKKFRKQYGLFVAEGIKIVDELLQSDLLVEGLYATAPILESTEQFDQSRFTEISEAEMKSISSLSEPPGILAVAKIPETQLQRGGELILYLEEIRDPGNLGTIIRSAEGFRVSQLMLSPNCVDPFSPKVVQASMGSLFRLPIAFGTLDELKLDLEKSHHFYAADMQGKNLYKLDTRMPAVLIMGGESNGLSDEILNSSIDKIAIPINNSLESLNVAVSTAVILAELRRRSPL
jgi:TrmH family RNA methyltransferase